MQIRVQFKVHVGFNLACNFESIQGIVSTSSLQPHADDPQLVRQLPNQATILYGRYL